MAVPQIVREFVGGAWRTREDVSSDGGSQPLTIVRVTLAFDTPNLTFPDAGVVLYTPAAGDRVLAAASAPVPQISWNGSTPTLYFFSQGSDYATDSVDSVSGNSLNVSQYPNIKVGNIGATEAWQFDGTTPFMAIVDDGAGGDPGSSQGELDLVLVILKAA